MEGYPSPRRQYFHAFSAAHTPEEAARMNERHLHLYLSDGRILALSGFQALNEGVDRSASLGRIAPHLGQPRAPPVMLVADGEFERIDARVYKQVDLCRLHRHTSFQHQYPRLLEPPTWCTLRQKGSALRNSRSK